MLKDSTSLDKLGILLTKQYFLYVKQSRLFFWSLKIWANTCLEFENKHLLTCLVDICTQIQWILWKCKSMRIRIFQLVHEWSSLSRKYPSHPYYVGSWGGNAKAKKGLWSNNIWGSERAKGFESLLLQEWEKYMDEVVEKSEIAVVAVLSSNWKGLSRECTLVNTWKPSRMNYFEGWEDQQSESFFVCFILVVWLWYNARENDLKLRIFFYCNPIFSARHSIFFQRS